MRYDSQTKKIHIGASELVRDAYRGISVLLPKDEDMPESNPQMTGDGYPFSSGGYDFLLFKSTDVSDGTVRITMPILRSKPSKEERAIAEGEGYINAFIHSMQNPGLKSYKITVEYLSKYGGEKTAVERAVKSRLLTEFFEKCAALIPECAEAEIERVTVRMPSQAKVKFPFKQIRAAQSEFIKSAYRVIAKGGELFAEAPTGTGKTVSALFPAIRALGDGRVDKVFYLTPKTTTAEAARECLNEMAKSGAVIRAVILTAKEKTCGMGLVCRGADGECSALRQNRLTEATSALFAEGYTVVTNEEVLKTAKEYGICPYELSLNYSELCDVIICDFNYLFDPRVYIRRYFESRGNYAFLIDEAHNLADRAREMYSAEISEADILLADGADIIGEYSKLKVSSREAAEKFNQLLFPLVKDELHTIKDKEVSGAYHTHRLPEGLCELIGALYSDAEEELMLSYRAGDGERDMRISFLKEYVYKIKKFADALIRFDDSFELFIFYNGGKISAKVFCLDTGNLIRERISLGRASVFFSATLSPIEYYRSVLGADRSSTVIALDSPFVKEQMRVCVMDNISTRTSERERTLPAVCRAIAATLSARRGNYIIFSPSYAYSEALYKLFSQKYPKIRAIYQKPSMSEEEKSEFLSSFVADDKTYLVAFCVLGGIYSEGIDLSGEKLIGAVVVGIGMPSLSYEREAIAAYYDEKMDSGRQYAYIYPGMNRVLQAAGRVIRTEDDRGVIVLIDDRFEDPIYRKTAPKVWGKMKFIKDPKELKEELEEFWRECDEEKR